MYPRILGVDVEPPAVAIDAATFDSNGNMVGGNYAYKCTYVTNYGETTTGPSSIIVTSAGSVRLSNIPVNTAREVIARRIYRTQVGAGGEFFFVTELSNNTQRVYIDILNDLDLGIIEPESNFASTVGIMEGSVLFSRQVLRSQQNLIADGVDRLTSTEILKTEYVFVTVPIANAGVRLPGINSDLVGLKITINNVDIANSLLIYPRSEVDQINGAPAGSPISLDAGFTADLIAVSATEWRSSSSLTAGVAGPPSGAAGGDLVGSYPTPSLTTTGVAAGSYGSATTAPVITVDSRGRLTSASNVAISVPPSGVAGGSLSGSYPNPAIAASGVPPGVYGAGNFIPVLDIAADGRVTNASQTPLVVTTSGAAGGDLSGTYPNPTLVPTGVPAGVYGSSTQVPQFSVDAGGRITGATNIPLTATPGGIAGGDLTGTYPSPQLALSGVVAGDYGNSANVPTITVDGKGRVTGVTTMPVSGGPPSGSAGGSLGGSYPNPSLSATGVAAGTYTKLTVNVEGRILTGANITASDIPSLTGDVTGLISNTVVSSIGGVDVAGSAPNKHILIGNSTASGNNNSILGVGAGFALTTGTDNVLIGADAGATTLGSNNICIGSGSDARSGASNEITIGNSTHTAVRFDGVGAIPVYPNNADAITGGLTAGCLYRTGADPDVLCIVH